MKLARIILMVKIVKCVWMDSGGIHKMEAFVMVGPSSIHCMYIQYLEEPST